METSFVEQQRMDEQSKRDGIHEVYGQKCKGSRDVKPGYVSAWFDQYFCLNASLLTHELELAQSLSKVMVFLLLNLAIPYYNLGTGGIS